MSELPDGWEDTCLGEITVLRGEKLDPATASDAPFIGLEDIEPHTSRIVKIGKGSDVKSSVARFSAGDLLYSRLRPYLNKAAARGLARLHSVGTLGGTPEKIRVARPACRLP